ncbi:unnamed protein product [Psylliodes chrysocephalus]|uniref:DUF4371 domain-containing protein n=1 Tax=Psylliodes chrysocephalus TaxID=3402493 RepID=A0A9P0GJ53_9CUCU|nr:unnamed protein product [Psylliodes chrysocephala]
MEKLAVELNEKEDIAKLRRIGNKIENKARERKNILNYFKRVRKENDRELGENVNAQVQTNYTDLPNDSESNIIRSCVLEPPKPLAVAGPSSSESTMPMPSSLKLTSIDIGTLVGEMKNIDDFTRYQVLKNHWTPDKSYVFPYSSHMKRGREEKRRVNHGHFEKHSWLALVRGQRLYCSEKLVTEPIIHFTKLSGIEGDLHRHQITSHHNSAIKKGFVDLHKYNYSDNDVDNTEPVITDKILGESVLKMMKSLGLDVKKCVGINCDGCSVNNSKVKGAAAAEIQKEAVNAIVCPCYNHALNLPISKSLSVRNVKNTSGTIQEIVKFFQGSAKRFFVLKKHLKHSLSSPCQTRSIERHDSILEFQNDLPKIVATFKEISDWEDDNFETKAIIFLKAVCDYEFIIILYTLADIFSVTLPFSKYLQSKILI